MKRDKAFILTELTCERERCTTRIRSIDQAIRVIETLDFDESVKPVEYAIKDTAIGIQIKQKKVRKIKNSLEGITNKGHLRSIIFDALLESNGALTSRQVVEYGLRVKAFKKSGKWIIGPLQTRILRIVKDHPDMFQKNMCEDKNKKEWKISLVRMKNLSE